MKPICIVLCLAAYVSMEFAVGSVELPNTASQKITSNEDSELHREERNGRQLKWLQPASYVLTNLNKPLAPGEDPAGRFFKIMQKANSISQFDMLLKVFKQALEDFNADSKEFSKQFEIFVTNEVRRFANTPNIATVFGANLSISITNATTNLGIAIRTLLQALIALGESLGLDLAPLLNALNSGLLGGLLSNVSGGPAGAGGALGGLSLGK